MKQKIKDLINSIHNEDCYNPVIYKSARGNILADLAQVTDLCYKDIQSLRDNLPQDFSPKIKGELFQVLSDKRKGQKNLVSKKLTEISDYL